jgi:hypothetical protein
MNHLNKYLLQKDENKDKDILSFEEKLTLLHEYVEIHQKCPPQKE